MALGHPSEVWAENQIDRPMAMLLLAAASSVGTLAPQAGFFAGPVVAQWRERFGPKRVVLGGAALIAAGFALLGVAREVWQFCVLYGLLGVTAGMTGTVPLATSFSNGCEQPRAGDGRGFKRHSERTLPFPACLLF